MKTFFAHYIDRWERKCWERNEIINERETIIITTYDSNVSGTNGDLCEFRDYWRIDSCFVNVSFTVEYLMSD